MDKRVCRLKFVIANCLLPIVYCLLFLSVARSFHGIINYDGDGIHIGGPGAGTFYRNIISIQAVIHDIHAETGSNVYCVDSWTN